MVDLELLNKSLTQRKDWPTFRAVSLHKGFITWLFKNYSVIEYCTDFYDSEPDVPEEWLFKRFGPESINLWENKEFLEEWNKLCEEYEPTRLKICNWQEPVFAGNWDMTQEQVDKAAHYYMLECRNIPINKKNRFWIGHLDINTIICYWYGRDLRYKQDRCWLMKRRIK